MGLPVPRILSRGIGIVLGTTASVIPHNGRFPGIGRGMYYNYLLSVYGFRRLLKATYHAHSPDRRWYEDEERTEKDSVTMHERSEFV